MKIVIDLQGAQIQSLSSSIGDYCLSLTKGIVRNRGEHEVIIALSGLFPSSIASIRASLGSLLPQKNIQIWYAPKIVEDAWSENEWRFRLSEQLREAFFASLKPDWIIVPTLFEVNNINFVSSIGSYLNKIPTAVLVHSFPVTNEKVDPNLTKINQQKTASLQRAKLCLTTLKLPLAEQIKCFGVGQEKVKQLDLPLDGLIDRQDCTLAVNQLFEYLVKFRKNKTCNAAMMPEYEKRLRLAYVSPLPPLQTGIADYSSILLPELARYYQIDVIVEQDEITDSWVKDNCTIHSGDWLLEHASEYDRVLYHMGNSGFHMYMFDLLKQVSGVVVLHDFYISGAVYEREMVGRHLHALNKELYKERGYKGVKERYSWGDDARVVRETPCNLTVIQQSHGVVFHSKYSENLLMEHHLAPVDVVKKVVPLLREPAKDIDRISARKQLGFSPDNFVICCFGLLNVSKQNHRLLDAWLQSSLYSDTNCRLIFVGRNSKDAYGNKMIQTIKKHKAKKQVFITGWVSTEYFHLYLAAADMAVQLRTMSRGESSAAILDTMNYGLPTIVNANGSMAELDSEAVCMMTDEFTDNELITMLENLRSNQVLRQKLSSKSKEIVGTRHAPELCAEKYFETIEEFNCKKNFVVSNLIEKITALKYLPNNKELLKEIAVCIDKNHPISTSLRTIFVDISATCRNVLKTGIERVAQSILMQLISDPPEGFKVEPVYLSDHGGAWHYRYARQYTLGLLECPNTWLSDDVIEAKCGDIVYGADLSGGMVVEAEKAGVFEFLSNTGVSIVFTIFDILPVKNSEMFPPGANKSFENWLNSVCRVSDKIVCISKAVADETCKWLGGVEREGLKPLKVEWFHLGSNFSVSKLGQGIPAGAGKLLERFKSKPTFLMVSTIEPRKGYLQTISAFEQLWLDGHDVNLVIVGKEGWKDLPDDQRRTIPTIMKRLRQHSELDKRLFWIEGSSDEYLEKIYGSADCLINTSEGEGFGLPLVEAAEYGLPIIARNLPVFREVAGDNISYFDGNSREALSQVILEWLNKEEGDMTPNSALIKTLTWKESTMQLLDRLL